MPAVLLGFDILARLLAHGRLSVARLRATMSREEVVVAIDTNLANDTVQAIRNREEV